MEKEFGKLLTLYYAKVEKRLETHYTNSKTQLCVITFNDSLLLLFDFAKGQPSGVL